MAFFDAHDAHDELDIGALGDLAFAPQDVGFEDVGKVKRLHLWFDVMRQHFGRQPVYKVRRVFMDAGGEVVRSNGQACHVGLQG